MTGIEPMPAEFRAMGLRDSTWAGLRPDERAFMNGTADAARPLPAGITVEIWDKLPPDVRRALRDAEAKGARGAEANGAAAAARNAKLAAENAETALEYLDAVGSFESNEAAMAVEGLIGYMTANRIDNADILKPLAAHVAAAHALADTEGLAQSAVRKLVEVAGLDVEACPECGLPQSVCSNE
jgi:hypothetical protein